MFSLGFTSESSRLVHAAKLPPVPYWKRENTCDLHVGTRFSDGSNHLTLKTMTNNISMTDDMKAVERWENEGGSVPTPNKLWASLKRFRTKDNSRERQVLHKQEIFGQQPGLFSQFNFQGVV